MNDAYIDDELQIATEQDLEDAADHLGLNSPICAMHDLETAIHVAPNLSVRAAIQCMIDNHVGCVVVVENNRLIGIFSERDVLRRVAAANINLDQVPVREVMTANPTSLPEDAPLVYALHQMTVGGFRHIPLIDSAGRPIAVISMRDVVASIVTRYRSEVLNIPDDPEHSWVSEREGA